MNQSEATRSNGNQYKLRKIEFPTNTGLILADIWVPMCTGNWRNVAKVGIFQGRGAINLARRTSTTCVRIVVVPGKQHRSRRKGWSPGAAPVAITPAGWLSPALAWWSASRRRSGGVTPEPAVLQHLRPVEPSFLLEVGAAARTLPAIVRWQPW
jgi:hypothetical protein